MRFFALYNDAGKLVAIGTGQGGSEITEAEYNALLSVILEKAVFVEKVYSGEITIDSVPVEWQEEITRRVNERIVAEAEAEAAERQSVESE